MKPATSGSFVPQSSLPGQSYRLISLVFVSSECAHSNCLRISGSSCVFFSEAVQILLSFLHSPIFAFCFSIAFVQDCRCKANYVSSSARHEEEPHDHIGSNSPTPSGIETPHPDLSDKRLPGLIGSYFGQVRSNPSSNRISQDTSVHKPPNVDNDGAKPQIRRKGESERSGSSSRSSGSIVIVKHGRHEGHTPPWLPDELPPKSIGQDLPETEALRLPPTPLSPTSSILQKESESAENRKSLATTSISSVAQALKNLVFSRGPLSYKARRHQSLPISSLTTNPVLAAHISNPSTASQPPAQKSSRSPTPASTKTSDKLPISKSFRESSRLTSDAATESRVKTTPPHTPRALSHEGGHPERKSPLSNANANLSQEWSNDENEKPTNGSKAHGIPVNAPKGKLSVKIDRARKLKPSYDPYVVCVFEWNEYISNGPKHDAMDVDEEGGGPKKGRKEALSSMPIRRTDSDMGKPMSIPMKSRQSSNNSNADGHDQNKGATVTDPQWAHEAML